jgi:hypothetical protein
VVWRKARAGQHAKETRRCVGSEGQRQRGGLRGGQRRDQRLRGGDAAFNDGGEILVRPAIAHTHAF